MPRSRESTWSDEQRYQRLDALYLWWPYATGSLKASIEALIDEVRAGDWDAERERQFFAYAEATWPARVAAQLYAREDQEAVWKEVVRFCLPATQVLLERLAEREGHTRFFDLLRSPSADFSFFSRERQEFALLLPQVYTILWKDYQAQMDELLQGAQQRLAVAKIEQRSATPERRTVFEREMIYGETGLASGG